MHRQVDQQGAAGYAAGFSVFIVLTLASVTLAVILKKTHREVANA